MRGPVWRGGSPLVGLCLVLHHAAETENRDAALCSGDTHCSNEASTGEGHSREETHHWAARGRKCWFVQRLSVMWPCLHTCWISVCADSGMTTWYDLVFLWYRSTCPLSCSMATRTWTRSSCWRRRTWMSWTSEILSTEPCCWRLSSCCRNMTVSSQEGCESQCQRNVPRSVVMQLNTNTFVLIQKSQDWGRFTTGSHSPFYLSTLVHLSHCLYHTVMTTFLMQFRLRVQRSHMTPIIIFYFLLFYS